MGSRARLEMIKTASGRLSARHNQIHAINSNDCLMVCRCWRSSLCSCCACSDRMRTYVCCAQAQCASVYWLYLNRFIGRNNPSQSSLIRRQIDLIQMDASTSTLQLILKRAQVGFVFLLSWLAYIPRKITIDLIMKITFSLYRHRRKAPEWLRVSVDVNRTFLLFFWKDGKAPA